MSIDDRYSLPEAAIERLLTGALDHISAFDEIDLLNQYRAEFRRRVPFHLRSYVAAYLVMKATQGAQPRREERGKKRRDENRDSEKTRKVPASGEPRGDGGAKKPKGPSEDRRPEKEEKRLRPEFAGEAITLFFGMGRRQHLYPRLVFKLFDQMGLGPESVADIRSFDNYTFVGVDPTKGPAIIEALNGSSFKGRKLIVNVARKKDEARPSDERGADGVDAARTPYTTTDGGDYDDEGVSDENRPDAYGGPEAEGPGGYSDDTASDGYEDDVPGSER